MTLAEFLANGAGLTLISLAVPAIFFMIYFAVYQSRRAAIRARRISRVQQASAPDSTTAKAALSLKRITKDSGIGALDALIKRIIPNPENLRAKLERTGLNITLGVYVMISALVGLVVILIGRFYPVLPVAAVILFSLFAAVTVPNAMVVFLSKRRLKKFLESFPEGIDLIVRGLRSDRWPPDMIARVQRDYPKFEWATADAQHDVAYQAPEELVAALRKFAA